MVKVCFEVSGLTYSMLERAAGERKKVGEYVARIVSEYVDVERLERRRKQLEEAIAELERKVDELERLLSRSQIVGVRSLEDSCKILLYDKNESRLYLTDICAGLVIEVPGLHEVVERLMRIVKGEQHVHEDEEDE